MPNCFSLTRKSAPEAGAVDLNVLDVELCTLLDVEVDEKFWCHHWYNSIGFYYAIGKSHVEVRTILKEPYEYDDAEALLKILDYLEANFNVDAWVER